MLVTALAGVLALTTGICTTGSTRTCKLAGCASAQQVCLADRTWGVCRCGCDDGNACTQDTLSGSQCVHTPVAVDDGNPCTADSCDPVVGVKHQPVLAGAPCSDVDVCAGGSACDAAGVCRPAAELVDDGNPCTEDSCTPFVGITHVPLSPGADCSDATVCNGIELCDGAGTCFSGAAPVVDDGNLCTADACDPVTGVSHYPLAAGTSCSDGNACNGIEACTASATCVGAPPIVDDGNPCTTDSCDPMTGVHHTVLAAGASCSDDNACNGAETCTSEAVCFPGTPPQVDDGDRCTVDACDRIEGVTHQAIPNCAGLPPDPADVAPPLDATTPSSMQDATAFLYTGQDPIQSGVVPGAIEATRAAVIRGVVRDRAGAPVPGVRIAVVGEAALGSTLTRQDGAFDLAVNGGGAITLEYSKSGYLSAQRKVVAPWANFTWSPDVVLIGFDTAVTAVVPGSSAAQVARGTAVLDDAGARRATMVFQPGTGASLRFKDGSTQPLGTFHVRATEYTVGLSGPQAMPGELPATSGYTYAVELDVDEAVAAGASVEYTKPVPFYVENFLGLRVGSIVPVGYYDRVIGQWVPSQDGRVVKILGVSRKLASIDANGDDLAEDATTLAALGFTDAERTQLATLYAVGTTLWRASVTHFSPFDLNFPIGCEHDCPLPNVPPPVPPTPDPDPDLECGSIIDCQNQALGESVPLVGTDARLHYTSHRAAGRRVERRITIPLTGGTVPSDLRRVELVVETAGQVFRESFSGSANQTYVYEWDGRDGYGRPVLGSAVATVRVGFTYQAVILAPSDAAAGRSFGIMSSTGEVLGVRPGSYFTRWSAWSIPLGLIDGRADGLYGWTLTPHHAYDPNRKVLYRGDGSMRFADASETPWVIGTIAGRDTGRVSTGDGGPAVDAGFDSINALAPAPDGTLFVADGFRVRKIDRSGTITTVAGGGALTDGAAEGAPATAAQIRAYDVALGPDGAMYIADRYSARVYKVGTDGRIRTFAGGGATGPGDGLPATQAILYEPVAVAVAPDGVVYVLESHNLRRIGLDGIITTIAGAGGFTGDDVPASRVALGGFGKLSVGPDGSIYLRGNYRWYTTIKRIGPDGYIRHFAGTNGWWGWAGDGGPATTALLGSGPVASAGPDGSVLITDGMQRSDGTGTGVLRLVTPDGIIHTIAGSLALPEILGDSGPALQASFHPTMAAAVFAPDGAIYLPDNFRVRKLERRAGIYSGAALMVASDDGSEVYHFDSRGRHLRTIDARTAVVSYSFAYDTAGRLIAMTDRDGGVTVIERDASGNARAIVAPFGQRTPISPDGYGYLADVTNPAGESWSFTNDAGGLLQTMTDPRGGRHAFTYDVLGRLTSDSNPGGGVKTLTRAGNSVSIRTALGRTSTYEREVLPAGDTRRVRTYPDGTQRIELATLAGTRTTTLPNGATISESVTPDPRFSMRAPLVTSSTTTPGGLTRTLAQSRSVTLSDPEDSLSVASASETIALNGKAFARVYTASSRTWVLTTPSNRSASITLDDAGRVSSVQLPGRFPRAYTHNINGQVASVTQGARSQTFGYDALGQLTTITDPLLRTSTLLYDGAGRVQAAALPGDRTLSFIYDANGNVTGVEPPGRPTHSFAYAATDRVSSYSPPNAAGVGLLSTAYAYDVDGSLTRVLTPDESVVSPTRDGSGRLSTIASPNGTTSFAYDTAGRVASVTTSDGDVVSYGYDGPLLTSETHVGTVSGAVAWTYDDDFRVVAIAVNGSSVSFGYDADGLLTRAGALDAVRDAATGAIRQTSLGSVTTTTSYDGYGATAEFAAAARATALYSYSLSRDDAGRIATKTDTVQGVTVTSAYGYDDAGRVANVWRDGELIASYGYDANGNRVTTTTPDGTEVSSFDDQDRLFSSGATTYAYRPNGELATKTVGGDTTAYDYDAFGNLRSARLPNGSVVEYVIDGRNRRVAKKLNGVLVEGFLYEGQSRPIAWLDESGAAKATFVYGLRVNVPEYMVTPSGTYRIITDERGSPRLTVDASSGSVAQRMDYDVWGNVVADTNPGFQPFGFAGGLYDRSTGLVRFGARDYDPATGRWTNKDPTRFAGGWNLYAYCYGDPVNYIDPRGRNPALVGAIEGAEIGSIFGPVGAFIGAVAGGVGVGYLVHWVWDYFSKPADPQPVPPGGPDTPCPAVPRPWPGWDPTVPPGPDFEWRGKPPVGGGEGSWHNPITGESLHPDLTHPAPIGPHWDWRDPDGNDWRINPDDSTTPK